MADNVWLLVGRLWSSAHVADTIEVHAESNGHREKITSDGLDSKVVVPRVLGMRTRGCEAHAGVKVCFLS